MAELVFEVPYSPYFEIDTYKDFALDEDGQFARLSDTPEFFKLSDNPVFVRQR